MSESTKAAYQNYLKTKTWKEKQRAAIERDEGRCRMCNSDTLLNVHHRCYPKTWGEEPLSDLVTLCARCHRLFHKNHKKKTKKKEPKIIQPRKAPDPAILEAYLKAIQNKGRKT